ncbi:alginate lyase family protein [Albibacterium sp.]|uniref:alginate lyase family protein n=1 Tax=Albibacterium sp. TaxID=2952885 RepID=UPI002CD64027|nr:alginate lyase family protein [Albibacterium sp.]HUH18939.1 alginate lyase family protein [Albibacterium sp.]
MIEKIKLLFNTVKYLKPIQIFYQLKYRLRKAGTLTDYNKAYSESELCYLSFKKLPPVLISCLAENEFEFLNLKVKFTSGIDWNYEENGKLWNYNLQYANYLLQENLSVNTKKELILSLYQKLDQGILPLEPYPASLRIINSIRFISHNHLNEEALYSFIYAELDFLSKRPEYHILGNHLMENGFALIMGGAFFSNKTWLSQGREILETELNEQILSDGAHFELSPMYHQIIFFRLLELIDWYSGWKEKEDSFYNFLIHKAEKMRAWLEKISFKSGEIPHFNDSAEGIAYSTNWLLNYADELDLAKIDLPLGEAGYRSFNRGNYECKVDAGQVGPSYQPGHAHADALSFILFYKNQPLFVEAGTSTYEIGKIRSRERSTSSHNTVVVNNTNQSQVWSGFRVAQRAIVQISQDGSDRFSAEHNGYNKFGINHKRSFEFKDKQLVIVDEAVGDKAKVKEFHLHFHPNIEIEESNNEPTLIILDKAFIRFEGALSIDLQNYNMANGYNNYRQAKKIVVVFEEVLETTITFVD